MDEGTLRDFFLGCADAKALSRDVPNGRGEESELVEKPRRDISDYEVGIADLLKLCDAVLSGTLSATCLESIGMCLLASDHFVWDGSAPEGFRVSEVIHEWSC